MTLEHPQTGAEPIFFYQFGAPFAEFSNMSRHTIEMDGEIWLSVEHYFQAQKFPSSPHQDAIRRAKLPSVAAWLGQTREVPLRADWESVKDDMMRKGVRAKFTQHPELRTLLLSTGETVLIEHSASDGYWGDGGDGSGKNTMGKILMEIRQELRSA